MSDRTGGTTFHYDACDQLTGVDYPHSESLSYTPDEAGNRIQMTDPDGGIAAYHYDEGERHLNIQNPFSEETSFQYDELGREKVKQLANGVTITREWDEIGRNKSLIYQYGETLIAKFEATYPVLIVDGIKYQQQTVTETVPGTEPVEVTYTFDKLYRLTHETRTGTDAYDIQYEYDATGNRTSKVENDVTTTYVYNPGNQLATWTVEGTEPSQTGSYVYDDNGNVTNVTVLGSVTEFTWDEENQLTEMRQYLDDGTIDITYAYDGFGFRREKNTNSEESVTVRYVWDDQNILQERSGEGDLLNQFTDYPGYWGGLTSQSSGTASDFFLFDFFGNLRFVADSSATITDSYIHTAYGVQLSHAGSGEVPYTFKGDVGYFDEKTGLYYVRQRYYDANTGRWLSQDPIWAVNLYQYCRSNPISFEDASGLAPKGHHLVPEATSKKLSGVLRKVWDADEFRISNPNYTFHNRKPYGGISEPEYRNAVEERLQKFAKSLGKEPKDLTIDEAKSFGRMIKGIRGGPIGTYNQAVKTEMREQLRALRKAAQALKLAKAAAKASPEVAEVAVESGEVLGIGAKMLNAAKLVGEGVLGDALGVLDLAGIALQNEMRAKEHRA